MFKTITLIAILLGASSTAMAMPGEMHPNRKPKRHSVNATTYRLLEVETLDFRYQKFKDRRDPYIPNYDKDWDYRAALDWDLTSLRYVFWDNSVHVEGLKDGRVKSVGWHWFLGVKIPIWNVDIYHEHHSQHVMDQDPMERSGEPLPQGYRKFPVEDSFGIRFNLYHK